MITSLRSAHVLAVRLDSDGDVLLTGPAVRVMAATAGSVDLLASPAAAGAGALLPGVRTVLQFDAPWAGYTPTPVDPAQVDRLVDELAAQRYEAAVIFTSDHQSPLPMALLARLAGIPLIAATSEDYPGSLLDVRHRRPAGMHEVEAALDLVRAAGFPTPRPLDQRLAVRGPLPSAANLVPPGPYVVVHPGASVPSRAPTPAHAREIVAELGRRGHQVVVTGGPRERSLAAAVSAGQPHARDLGGRTTLASLAAVLAGADCVIAGNTGPAHLAAAVGTPVVSLFSPVVPAQRWAPWGVASVVLGDQQAPCAGSRARVCPVPGHPCLTAVPPQQVADAAESLIRAEVLT